MDPEEYEQALLAEINGRKTAGLPKWTIVQANWEGEHPNSVLKVTYRDHRRELTEVHDWPIWGAAAPVVNGPDGLTGDPESVATLILAMIDEAVEAGSGGGVL